MWGLSYDQKQKYACEGDYTHNSECENHEEHNHDNYCGQSLPADWTDLQKDHFWCNDANVGLLTHKAEFNSQVNETCTITVGDSSYEYGNCDCSDPENYDFENTGRFQILRGTN